MDNLNGYLKLIFIVTSAALLVALLTFPQTDCQACSLEFEGKKIDGYKAFSVFEDACMTYSKPWDATPEPVVFDNNYTKEYIYIDIDTINATVLGDGTYIINFTETPLE